jgi:hypothetical protein
MDGFSPLKVRASRGPRAGAPGAAKPDRDELTGTHRPRRPRRSQAGARGGRPARAAATQRRPVQRRGQPRSQSHSGARRRSCRSSRCRRLRRARARRRRRHRPSASALRTSQQRQQLRRPTAAAAAVAAAAARAAAVPGRSAAPRSRACRGGSRSSWRASRGEPGGGAAGDGFGGERGPTDRPADCAPPPRRPAARARGSAASTRSERLSAG